MPESTLYAAAREAAAMEEEAAAMEEEAAAPEEEAAAPVAPFEMARESAAEVAREVARGAAANGAGCPAAAANDEHAAPDVPDDAAAGASSACRGQGPGIQQIRSMQVDVRYVGGHSLVRIGR